MTIINCPTCQGLGWVTEHEECELCGIHTRCIDCEGLGYYTKEEGKEIFSKKIKELEETIDETAEDQFEDVPIEIWKLLFYYENYYKISKRK